MPSIKLFLPLAITAALPLTACATATTTGSTDVTRFTRAEALTPGTVSIAALPDSAGGSITTASLSAVSRELGTIGYPSAGTSEARYTVSIRLEQGAGESFTSGSPGVSVGVGGSTGGWRGGGVGVGVGLDLTSLFNKPRTQVNTRLSVSMRDKASGVVVWEGRAENRAQVVRGDDPSSAIADKLAAALFKGFPGQSGETITVR